MASKTEIDKMMQMPLGDLIAMLAGKGGGSLEVEVEPKEGEEEEETPLKPRKRKRKGGLSEMMGDEEGEGSEDDQEHVNASYS
jgi:hypothetical protein